MIHSTVDIFIIHHFSNQNYRLAMMLRKGTHLTFWYLIQLIQMS